MGDASNVSSSTGAVLTLCTVASFFSQYVEFQAAPASAPSASLMDIMAATDDAMSAVTRCNSVDVYFAQMMLAHHKARPRAI